MVGVVDAARLDHQQEALRVATQDVDGFRRHLGQRGLAAAVVLELHVMRARTGRAGDGSCAGPRPETALRSRRTASPVARPARGLISARPSLRSPRRSGYSGSRADSGMNAARPPPSTTSMPSLRLRGDQLRGDVRHGRAGGQLRVPLPVAVRRVRVQRRRRGVRDAGGGDEAGRESARGGLLEQRRHRVLRDHGRVRHIARDGLVHRQRTVAGLDAGEQRRGGRGRVRRLLRDRIRLRQRQVRQLLEGQFVFLAGTAAALAFQDAGEAHGGHAHAVADEQDHVAGPAGVRCLLCAIGHGRGAGAVPGRGFRGGRRLGLGCDCAVQASPARTAASSGRKRGYVRIRVFSTKNIGDGPLESLVSVFHR